MHFNKFVFWIIYIFTGICNIFGQLSKNNDSLHWNTKQYLIASSDLENQLSGLNEYRINRNAAHTTSLKNGRVFKVVHIGDSHVQMGYMDETIRTYLQDAFGNAGNGFVFPYSLAKSFGPRGLLSQSTGLWQHGTWLKNNDAHGLALTGYSLKLLQPKGALLFTFEENNAVNKYNLLRVWHCLPQGSQNITARIIVDSQNININKSLNLQNREEILKQNSGSIFQSDFDLKSDAIVKNLELEFTCDSTSAVKPEFLGFQWQNNRQQGIEYHSYGVVGAQFNHFLAQQELCIAQLKSIQPNIVIFSFGSNEAYNSGWDSANSKKKLQSFFTTLRSQLPGTAILVTSCPDTRSAGTIPPMQKSVNTVLKTVSMKNNLSFFDLNLAMGGWGAVYKWNQAGLVMKDMLHFNANGYRLQGKMLVSALFETYNKRASYPIETEKLNAFLDSMLRAINKPQPLTEDKPRAANELFHTVKKGESLYAISKKYKVPVEGIKTLNHLHKPYIIRPGDKLRIR
jgi:lysophospholipase L1-like esterase